MSKELEALERLKTAPTFMGGTIEYQACTKSETLLLQDYGIVKQALLNAEKEHNSVNLLMQELDCKDFAELRKYARCGYEKLNKKYLKWEDLEFSKELKILNVRMNNNDYILKYTLDVFGVKCCFLYDSEITHHISLTKQFFNDLYLEVLE